MSRQVSSINVSTGSASFPGASLSTELRVRKIIRVSGIVQGVGFRPTVYRLAVERQLSGFVLNNGQGVRIEVEGPLTRAESFLRSLTAEAPPLSRIDQVDVEEGQLTCDREFVIRTSDSRRVTDISIPADKGVCAQCLKETFEPGNRHYRYPFTNCTHCGPRYSLVRQLPYDRPATGMSAFDMCPACARAYSDPLDRRYHAQPVSCNHCGPQLGFTDSAGVVLARRDEAMMGAVDALKQGKIVAVKGIGGFHLMCDASRTDVVARLREGKCRPRKPLAIMVNSLEMAEPLVVVTPKERELLCSPERPVTLLRKRPGKKAADCQTESSLAENIAPGVPWLGVMLAYTPLHYLLMESIDTPLVATSANRSGMPILTECTEVIEQLGSLVDRVLDHNRPIVHACDDSVAQIAGDCRQILRLGRGYAPLIIPLLSKAERPLVALGAQQKTGIALARGQQMIVGPYQGDLDSLEMEFRFSDHLSDMGSLTGIEPQRVISDRHPEYATTRIAASISSEDGRESVAVQHHHAHILSVMAEHQLTEEVLGFAFDGTGYGDDSYDSSSNDFSNKAVCKKAVCKKAVCKKDSGLIWGGEVLLADVHQARRCHHLKPFRLIGGERAIKEPARILLGMLLEYYRPDQIRAMDLPAFRNRPDYWLDNLYAVWQNAQRSPLTTSMGRMIDGWASLLGLVDSVAFEGECGLALENEAVTGQPGALPAPAFYLADDGVIQWDRQLQWFIKQRRQLSVPDMASTLLTSIARLVTDIADRYPDHKVIVSGGVFQNRTLMDSLIDSWVARFPSRKQSLLMSENLPLNDGGISAGQLWHGLMSA